MTISIKYIDEKYRTIIIKSKKNKKAIKAIKAIKVAYICLKRYEKKRAELSKTNLRNEKIDDFGSFIITLHKKIYFFVLFLCTLYMKLKFFNKK